MMVQAIPDPVHVEVVGGDAFPWMQFLLGLIPLLGVFIAVWAQSRNLQRQLTTQTQNLQRQLHADATAAERRWEQERRLEQHKWLVEQRRVLYGRHLGAARSLSEAHNRVAFTTEGWTQPPNDTDRERLHEFQMAISDASAAYSMAESEALLFGSEDYVQQLKKIGIDDRAVRDKDATIAAVVYADWYARLELFLGPIARRESELGASPA